MSTVEISKEERDLWRFEASDECGTPSDEDERILRLLNALETTEVLLDGSVQETRANFSAVYQACTEIIPDLKATASAGLARAEKADADAREWREQIPEECPITGLPYWNSLKNSAGVYQPFYGGPVDVYGIPYKDEDGYLCRKHICLDSMREEDESMGLQAVEEERMIDLEQAEAEVVRLRERLESALDKIAEIQDEWESEGVCHACGICAGIPYEWQPTEDHCCRVILDLWSNGEPLPWEEAARKAVEGEA